ncbi:MAG TPA: hypothetical protein ENL28_01545 [Candidatus Atribacteria bacterium]|nr:hypothetical protein [Candidatus Atribacteria bacterium]
MVCALRVAFVYSTKDQDLVNITKYMIALFEKSGHMVKAVEVENLSSPISFRPFDLVLVGAKITSLFGGKISQEVVKFLQGANGMEGKKSVAYVKSALFGTDKALRRLMGHMESRGAFVVDFEAIRGQKEAEELVKRHL